MSLRVLSLSPHTCDMLPLITVHDYIPFPLVPQSSTHKTHTHTTISRIINASQGQTHLLGPPPSGSPTSVAATAADHSAGNSIAHSSPAVTVEIAQSAATSDTASSARPQTQLPQSHSTHSHSSSTSSTNSASSQLHHQHQQHHHLQHLHQQQHNNHNNNHLQHQLHAPQHRHTERQGSPFTHQHQHQHPYQAGAAQQQHQHPHHTHHHMHRSIPRNGSYVFSDCGSTKIYSDAASLRSIASIGMGSTDGKKMVIRRVPTSPTELLTIINQPG